LSEGKNPGGFKNHLSSQTRGNSSVARRKSKEVDGVYVGGKRRGGRKKGKKEPSEDAQAKVAGPERVSIGIQKRGHRPNKLAP